MKKNYTYILVAVAIVIMTLILLNRGGETGELNSELGPATTTVSTQTTNTGNTGTAGTASKPANTTIVAPKPTSPAPTATSSTIGSLTGRALNGAIVRLSSYNGVAVPADSKYVLEFENGRLSAKFCNSLSGEFVVDRSTIRVGNLVSTKMFCSSPANLMDMETDFSTMLTFGAHIAQSGNTIIINNDATVMVFTGFGN